MLNDTAGRPVRRRHLFPKYALLISLLVGGMLVASGAVVIYFSYRENQEHVIALQAEKAQAAATRIEQFVLNIEHQLGWTALPRADATGGVDPREARYLEYLKLLRQVPPITDVAWIDADGREQLRVSRLAMNEVGRGVDRTTDPAYRTAMGGKMWFGPVYFRLGTEPYMVLARPAGAGGGVVAAEVNLKFVWDVVSRIQVGTRGLAYVVDAEGTLIAHPDISLVLKKTDMAALPQVAARMHPGSNAGREAAHDLTGQRMLAAYTRIPTLGWTVFVESPPAEAFAPLYAMLQRMGLVLVLALVISAAATFFLARALVRPLRMLQAGAARIGAGDLDRTIEVRTGDELEGLADQFNRMAAQLRESYAQLERKVELRTAELSESLAFQTAISEVLRVISESPNDVQPVFEAILDSAVGLFGSRTASVLRYDDGLLHRVAQRNWSQLAVEDAGRYYPGPPDPHMLSGRVIAARAVVTIDDAAADPGYDPHTALAGGWRRMLGAPLLKDGAPIGVIVVAWDEPGPTPQRQIDLLETFAGQAAIAIENLRLMNETKEALAQQTVTSEVLRVISSSVADEKPAFDAILDGCQRFFAASGMGIALADEDGTLHNGGFRGTHETLLRALVGAFPRPLQGSATGVAIRERRVVHYADALAAADAPPALHGVAEAAGNFSIAIAPMLWEQRGVGAVVVVRDPPHSFSEKELVLLKTFADQAVIAIQNARLVGELQEKGQLLALANQHKSEFLANMSHELRTPLNAIIGFSEVLAERMFGEVNEKQLEYLQDIHASGHHLLSLINDILDLSKIEAGRMELDLSSFDLPMLLDNTTTLVRERALRHGLTLAQDIDVRLGEWVADARKLKQVVINLLSNAVKFTPAGGRVTLCARLRGDAVEIAVVDTGVGIPADQQALVFEEFRQATGDYLRKSEGTGLGLPLARRFVELHGGTLRVESAPGEGSTFAFTLPRRTLDATARD
ncbi:HAMP domain-containing histidine kinase [Variovorax sp. KK3]|uniref:HAMP domain-containing histidine kinase n=1 Tax=Variovorax sp. KK3 TaxID=1855728 RepID=UPI00097C44EB|nr:HAMP domain-containing histidine kinase [Variovorax sp. KK3]